MVALGILTLAGCHSRTEETFENQNVLSAYKFIDRGEERRAIEILEPIVRKNPGHEEARVALASAYVSLAHLPFHRFFDLARTFVKNDGTPDLVDPGTLKLILSKYPDASGDLKKYLLVIKEFQTFLDRFEKIPSIEPGDLPNLNYAVQILEDSPAPLRGTVLFRVLLKVVRFKYFWTTKNFFKIQGTCQTDGAHVRTGIEAITGSLTSVFYDLALSFPKNKTEFFGIISQIKSISGQMTAQLGFWNDQINVGTLVGEDPCG